MRLDKFVAKSTTYTKQQVREKIEDYQISVNGIAINHIAHQVHENNAVFLNGKLLEARPFRYLLLHKPVNTICSNVDEVYPSVLTMLKQTASVEHVDELHIAGRLDVDTTGLVLVTDDGRWTFNITRPDNHCKKTYRVGLSKVFNADLIQYFNAGIQLQGEAQLTLPAAIEQVSDKEVLLTITEGKFHQVKRMFAALGNRVVRLHREQIGAVKLDVKVGQWRYLTPLEVMSFSKA